MIQVRAITAFAVSTTPHFGVNYHEQIIARFPVHGQRTSAAGPSLNEPPSATTASSLTSSASEVMCARAEREEKKVASEKPLNRQNTEVFP